VLVLKAEETRRKKLSRLFYGLCSSRVIGKRIAGATNYRMTIASEQQQGHARLNE
jgi:hypothetical protein